MRSVLRRAAVLTFGLAGLYLLCVGVAWLRVAIAPTAPSHSVGHPGRGHLVAGRPMPPSGDGFTTYSYVGSALGRQYLHEAVQRTLQSSFAAVAAHQPGRRFQLAETGWRTGGRLRPHRTHQSGMSADILMPVDDEEGRPAQLSTAPWRLFGYGWEFDARGRSEDLRISFETLARLLRSLEEEGAKNGLRIELVIIAPEYVPLLLETESGRRPSSLWGKITRKPVWIRHDEHMHVDFASR